MSEGYSSSWHSYPSIFNIGHRAAAGLFTGVVNIEEKLDGSQFSFGVFNPTWCGLCGLEERNHEGVIDGHGFVLASGREAKVRSKGAVMQIGAPMSLFAEACKTVEQLAPILEVGWTYRGEVLKKPKHNTLHYDRVPHGHIIIFDINPAEEAYLSYEEKVRECERIGLECVPRLYTGLVSGVDQFRQFLSTTSVLGGQKIEGVVVKPVNYDLFGADKKVIMGKYVSELFKEAHGKEWKASNPKSGDILQQLTDKYCHAGRWAKARQHLLEAGQLENSPRDIPKLMIEVQKDIGREEEDEIKKVLWKWAIPAISRGAARGLPEWYKQRLLEDAFEKEETSADITANHQDNHVGVSTTSALPSEAETIKHM